MLHTREDWFETTGAHPEKPLLAGTSRQTPGCGPATSGAMKADRSKLVRADLAVRVFVRPLV